jgi:elongation factor P hydroxylase
MARPVGHPDNSLLATAANHERWAAVDDLTAATEPARKAFEDRFLRQARERFGDLPPDELARRAEHLRKAYYARLALKSAQARRARKQNGPAGE